MSINQQYKTNSEDQWASLAPLKETLIIHSRRTCHADDMAQNLLVKVVEIQRRLNAQPWQAFYISQCPDRSVTVRHGKRVFG